MSRSIKWAPAPSGNSTHLFQLGLTQLEEFLSEGEFVERMFAARWRTIRVFVNARSGPGRRATPGYVLGLDNKLSSVVKFVYAAMNVHAQRKIFSASDLPEAYQLHPRRTQEFVAACVRDELLMRLLVLMRDANHLWYMDGEWCMPQSVLDEYLLMFKAAGQNYRNDSSFHGRPNSDRARLRGLRMAPGVSTGS